MDQLSTELLHQLSHFSTCSVANAIESLGVRLRNEGYTDGSIRLLTEHKRPVAGYAATVKIKCSSPPPIGPRYIERTQWWDYLLSMPAPRFIVIEDVDPIPGTAAFIGEVHTHILKALGCVAAATNGAIRDVPEIEALDFPVFGRNPAVSHAYAHIVEIGSPVTVGGLTISPGDLMHGDYHGLVNVPKSRAGELPEIIAAMINTEKQIIAICEAQPFSLTSLRNAIHQIRSITL